MTILEFVARTFSPIQPDGRFIFRPWGKRGPCYLLSAEQRKVRAWVQLAFYLIAVVAVGFIPAIVRTMAHLISFWIAVGIANYILYWFFSIGLHRTDPPGPMSPAQRRDMLAATARSMGRPVLWFFLIVSALFVAGGFITAMVMHQWISGLLGMGFFGACAAVFIQRLRLIAATNT